MSPMQPFPPADPAHPLPSDSDLAGHTVCTDVRERESDLPPEDVWPVIESVGGANGWYSTPLLWTLRGVMDTLVGGPGLRGRRDPDHVRRGDVVDWWRVEDVEPGRRLTLRAEMKAGGRAWLQLSTEPRDGGGSVYRQRAVFIPDGLLGRAYWTAVLPFHAVVFPEMAANLLAEAERRTTGGERRRTRGLVRALLARR